MWEEWEIDFELWWAEKERITKDVKCHWKVWKERKEEKRAGDKARAGERGKEKEKRKRKEEEKERK